MSKEEVLDALLALPDADREEVLKSFCAVCHTPISGPDWSGGNYCYACSPDPGD